MSEENTARWKVPLFDLDFGEEEFSAVQAVLASKWLTAGEQVERFEEEFAGYCGRRYAVGVSSGTSALHLALLAMGTDKGQEVITAANTFIATTEAVTHAGGRAKLVDIGPDSFNMDPSLLEAAVTEQTKILIPVHLYGQTADMDAIKTIADKHDLLVLEDAAQAQGAE